MIDFELVSPEALLIAHPVDMVVVPGGDGYYGVLVGHVPMITTVRAGAITTYEENIVADRIFVTGGFAEVAGDRVTILVEGAVKVEELDKAKVEQDIKNFGEDVEDAKTDEEKAVAQRNLAIAQAQLFALQELAAEH